MTCCRCWWRGIYNSWLDMLENQPKLLGQSLASDCREEVAEKQLRDDLLSMLVAGHETTGSALTWTLHLLASNPATLAKVRPQSAEFFLSSFLTFLLNGWLQGCPVTDEITEMSITLCARGGGPDAARPSIAGFLKGHAPESKYSTANDAPCPVTGAVR